MAVIGSFVLGKQIHIKFISVYHSIFKLVYEVEAHLYNDYQGFLQIDIVKYQP